MTEVAEFLLEGTVITMDAARRVIFDGAVAVRGDRIVGVGKAAELESRYRAERVLGGPRRFVVPGLIDCHNHAAQPLVRELAIEDFPNIYRCYVPSEQVLDDDSVRLSATFMAAQLLRAGVTHVTETTVSPAHERPVAETLLGTGIRCTMGRGSGSRTSKLASAYEQAKERSRFRDDPGLAREDIAASEDFLRTWSGKGEGRLRPWLHLRGVPSVSDDHFVAAAQLVEKYGAGFMSHINRDREEVELVFSLFGRRPIEHLHSLGVLGPRFVAIHAMLTTDREIQMLAEARSGVAHAPIVCTDLVSAVTRVVAMRAAGVKVGLACDTVINDILGVMRIAHLMHAQATGIPLYDPVSLTSQDVFEMGTIGAARLLGWDEEIGSLEVGKAADVTVIDGNNTRLAPTYEPVGTLVRYASGSDVESVLVAGRLVVDGGVVLTIDERQLLDEAVELGKRLRSHLEPRRYRPMTSEEVL